MSRSAALMRHSANVPFAILDFARSGTGAHYFVHSGTGLSTNNGQTIDSPMATLQQAIELCTAGQGDHIWLMAGHAESITTATALNASVAGIFINGLGSGEHRPILTFSTVVGSLLTISAANVTLRNVVLKNDIDGQVVMVDVNAADFTMEDCEIREGSAKQAVTYIDLGEDRARIRRCKITATTAGAASGIKLSAAKDGTVIEDCVIDGDFDDAGIHNPTGTVCTNLLMKNNVVRNRQTGDHAIELVSACTGSAVDNRLFGDTFGTVFDPGSLFCAGNRETNGIDSDGVATPTAATSANTVEAALWGANGITTWPAAAAPGNGVSISEAIRAIYNNTLNSVKNFNALSANYFTVTADMTSATWNTAASHEIATVTGLVRMRVIIQCTGTLTDAADGASIQFGVEGSTAALIGSTGAAGAGGNTISANEFWVDTSPAELVLIGTNQALLDFIVGGGLDVGYEITGAALTGGTLVFHVWWEPLDATGAVAAGAGGAL